MMLCHRMNRENRHEPRFRDFARAVIEELCPFPGYLEDVSVTGCKVRFAHSFDVDIDREYSLAVQPGIKAAVKEFVLTVKPEWFQNDGENVEIGFTVLRSPGARQFINYVETLASLEEQELQEA